MIKNELIKDILTNTLFRLLSMINQIIPKDDHIILLYSNMGIRDNLKAIYDYMIENGYNYKYRIVMSGESKTCNKLPQNVSQVNNFAGVWWYLKAGHVFYAFGRIPIHPSKKQYVVQMWHGTPFKAPDQHQLRTAPKKSYYTSMLISSLYFKDIIEKAHGIEDENIAVCGQPRTDVMFKACNKYQELEGYSKVVIWMPTFRKSSILGYSDVKKQKSVIPIFDIEDYQELNATLNKKKILLIVKLHPLEDVEEFKSMNLSNLMLLSHEEFMQRKWDLYKLMAQCDALITDYSSVFYDFMLLNRPLAFTIDDYNDYKEGRGFAVDNPDYLTPGYKITNKSQFRNFINDIADGKDIFKDERNKINEIVNTYNDGNQCKRALNIANVKMEDK